MTGTPRTPPEQRKRLEDLLLSTYFASVPRHQLDCDTGRFIIGQHVWQRYEQARYSLAPWVDRAVGLAGRRIVEIGSGTGSSTAGFAALARTVDGYEIDQPSIAFAHGRFEVLGVRNATANLVAGDDMVKTVCDRHRGNVDAFLFFAVLEHMTIPERLVALRTAWSELPSGGVLIVIETPNRLTYTDLHTAQMPFFHMLPTPLALHYYPRSQRIDFVENVTKAPPEERELTLQRWGNGVSFHEFDVGIGPEVDQFIRADGFEPEVTGIYPLRLDDELLGRYFEAHPVRRHRAWTRNHLNLVLAKP